MEILDIQSHEPLRKAKQHLITAVSMGVVVSVLFPFLFQSVLLFNIVLLAVLYYGSYALYQFSTIARTFLFRYYLYMFGAQLASSFLLPALAAAIPLEFALICCILGVAACNIYCAQKMSYEMSRLTDLAHFVSAFKIYVVCVGATLLAAVLVGFGLDISALPNEIQTDEDIFAFIDSNKNLLLTFSFVCLVILCALCISVGFLLRGLVKMTYIKCAHYEGN